MSGLGLLGRSVVVTRAPHQAGAIRDRLEALGARVIELPTIQIAPPEDWTPVDAALARIASFDLVLLGSVNAARCLAARAALLRVRVECPLGVVGEKTAAAIASDPAMKATLRGAHLIPPVFRAESLADTVVAHFLDQGGVAGRRFLHPRAEEGRMVLVDRLSAAGAIVEPILVYRIAPAAPASEDEIAAVAAADAITFLSGETLASFLEVIPKLRARQILERATVAVIGPVAAERAAALSVRVDVMPAEATVEAMVAALSERLPARGGSE